MANDFYVVIFLTQDEPASEERTILSVAERSSPPAVLTSGAYPIKPSYSRFC